MLSNAIALLIAPEFARLAAENKETAIFLKVDGDANRALVQSKSVQGYPTFHFYVKSSLVDQFSGNHYIIPYDHNIIMG